MTTETQKDAQGNIIGETKTSVIANAGKNTSATVKTVTDSEGKVTSVTAAVEKTGTKTSNGSTRCSISADVVGQIVAAAGTTDVAITQKVTTPNGGGVTVTVNAKNLVSRETLKIMKVDPKTGELVLYNKKDYDVNGAGGLNLTMKEEGEFVLMSEKEAKAKSDEIIKTIKVKDSKKTVKPGKTTKVTLSSKLDMKNVSKITYKTDNSSVATVNKNGKVTTKKKGTVTVTAKVTLKNGKTKTVKMKITVK